MKQFKASVCICLILICFGNSLKNKRLYGDVWFYPNLPFISTTTESNTNLETLPTKSVEDKRKSRAKYIFFRGDPREFIG